MKTQSFMPTKRTALALMLTSALAFAIAGCSSTHIPTEKMAVAEAAVQRANTSSTSENAAAELQLAKDTLTNARKAMNDKDYKLAGQLAEEAEVDAQVAVLHAESVRSQKAAQESQDAARVLREELNRKQGR